MLSELFMNKFFKLSWRNMSEKNLIRDTLTKKLKKAKESNNVEVDIEDSAAILSSTKSKYFSPVQTRQQRKAKKNLKIENEVKQEEVQIKMFKPEWEPENWRQCLDNIREMRLNSTAPVDTMGCHKCSDAEADEKTQRFQKLVALMLSSQTKDETTFEAMQRLKSNELTPESIVSMEATKLEQLLHPVSFYKNKSKYLQQTSRILIDKYDSDIPNNIKELIALPGVGPKMAHICMSTAWNQITGIGVDVHVHRISNRLGWVPKQTKEPEQTRQALESWVPRDLWQDVNHLFVGFGQTICTPQRPQCSDCLNKYICPSADKTAKTKTARKSDSSESALLPIKKAKYQQKKKIQS